MNTFELGKNCEVCKVAIPDSYNNLLCDEHYKKDIEEKERIQEMNKDEKQTDTVNGIINPNYVENEEVDDKDQVMTNIAQFFKTNTLLFPPTRYMYAMVKDYMIEKTQKHAQFSKHIWKPTVVDVGCGSGVGTNILSWEADFVWGIDKNEMSVNFARQAFTREKNGIYYSSQVMFDAFDIIKETRDTQWFDIVVAIEIIEHIKDYKTFLETIIGKFAKRDKKGQFVGNKDDEFYTGTEFFISTPNRTHPKLGDDKPKNQYHVREWTQEELVAVLSHYFSNVELYNYLGDRIVEYNDDSPVLAKCRI